MTHSLAPYVLTNQNSPCFWINNNLWMPLAGSFLTANRFTFLEQLCGTGIGGPPTHTHPTDEGLYIVDGHCTFYAGGETVEAGPGTFVAVPRGTEHSFTVDVAGTRLLNFYTPGGFEMIIFGLAQPAAERKLPVPDAFPLPARWLVEELSREYGQQGVLGLPFADPPSATNMATRPNPANPRKPYGLHVAQAPAYWLQDSLWTVLASTAQTGGSYSLMEQLCPLGAGPPPHAHEQDEAIYVLEGELTLIAGPERVTAPAGSFAYIPAHCVHSFRVDSPTARLLNFYLPGGFERTITELAPPAQARTLPPAGAAPAGRDEPSAKEKALFEEVGTSWLALPDVLRQEKR